MISLFHKIATSITRKFQSLLGLVTLGPRAIIINDKNQVLLVKHTYQPHWYLPGGGVDKGESIKAALLRELVEEVGVIPVDEPLLFGIYFHTYMGVNDYPIIYVIKNFTLVKADSPEIEKMDWYSYDHLPENISPGTKRRLDEYFARALQTDQW